MNTISKAVRFVRHPGPFALVFALALLGCLQGPWDYYPENPSLYRGIWVSGHVVAGRPIDNVCFEKLLNLDETSTRYFAFYDSAYVTVSGSFGGKDTLLVLQAQTGNPNCFAASTDLVPVAAQAYQMQAVIVWDSSGTSVTSRLSGTAHTPTSFRILEGLAPSPAILGNNEISAEAMTALYAEFGDTLTKVMSDSVALLQFYSDNQEKIGEILAQFRTAYQSGDTIFFMTGANSLMSHYYTNERSEDVSGILVSRKFDSINGAQGLNSFDTLFVKDVSKIDTSGYILSGNIGRLLYLPSIMIDGANYLDSIIVVNSWYLIGPNTFYFYATETAYSQYIETAIEQGDDSRIRKVYNIEGGAGFFAGFLVDSFAVYTDTVPGTVVFSLKRARELKCEEDGWQSEVFCSSYWPTYCADYDWSKPSCAVLGVATALDTGSSWEVGVSRISPALEGAALDSAQVQGIRLHCIGQGFPSEESICDAPAQECRAGILGNVCQQTLWGWCEDRRWPLDTEPQCGNALVSYVKANQTNSSVLDREVAKWCAANPSDPQCN